MEISKVDNVVVCKISIEELNEKWGVTPEDVGRGLPVAESFMYEIMERTRHLLDLEENVAYPLCVGVAVAGDYMVVKIYEITQEEAEDIHNSLRQMGVTGDEEEMVSFNDLVSLYEDWDLLDDGEEGLEELPIWPDVETPVFYFDGFHYLIEVCRVLTTKGIRSSLLKKAGYYVLAIEEKLGARERALLSEYSQKEYLITDFQHEKSLYEVIIDGNAIGQLGKL